MLSASKQIQEQVEEQLALSHSRIVKGVFQHMLNKHNVAGCQCNYCKLLKPYIEKILLAHRIKRIADKYYYEGYEVYDQFYSHENYLAMKREIKRMKKEKDALKLLTPKTVNHGCKTVSLRGINNIHIRTSGNLH